MNRSSARWPSLGIALALAGMAMLAYARPLFLGETYMSQDHLSYTLPYREHLAQALAAGRIPEWWDAIGFGVPFAASPANGVTYPIAWIVALFPPLFGGDFLLVLHGFWAGLGTALLSRRLGADRYGAVLAGSIIMTCGYVASVFANAIPLLALAWTPWIAGAADRLAAAETRREQARAALITAMLVALQVLAGDPVGVITGGALALGIVVTRSRRRARGLLLLGASVLAALPLASLSLLPSLHLLGDSTRAAGIESSAAQAWSLHPLRIFEWVWPQFLGDPARYSRDLARVLANTSDPNSALDLAPSWAMSGFVGAPVFLLVMAAALPRDAAPVRKLLWMSAFFVLLALGRFTPVYGLYRGLVWPEQFVRYPEKHIVGPLVIWAVLAGVGATRTFEGKSVRTVLKSAVVCLFVFVGALVLLQLFRSTLTRETTHAYALKFLLDVPKALYCSFRGGAAATAALAIFALALSRRGWQGVGRRARFLVALAILGPLVVHTWFLQPTIERSLLARRPEILGPLPQRAQTGDRLRILTLGGVRHDAWATGREIAAAFHDAAAGNTPSRFGYAALPGYDVVLPLAHRQFFEHAAMMWRALVLGGVDYFITDTPATAHGGTSVAKGPAGYEAYSIRRERPRAFVTPRWLYAANLAEVDAELYREGSFDGRRVLVLGSGTDGTPDSAPDDVLAACRAASPRPERVELTCDDPRGGMAVLLDAWSPGWTATVDGRPVPMLRADMLFRAVQVPPGAHQIVHTYRTPGLRTGAIVSGGAWSGGLALLFCLRRSAKRHAA